MAIVDSVASFTQHCDSIDSTSALKNLLGRQRINTYAKLAFAIGNPQKPPSEEEFANFCTTLNGGTELTIGDRYFNGFAMAMGYDEKGHCHGPVWPHLMGHASIVDTAVVVNVDQGGANGLCQTYIGACAC